MSAHEGSLVRPCAPHSSGPFFPFRPSAPFFSPLLSFPVNGTARHPKAARHSHMGAQGCVKAQCSLYCAALHVLHAPVHPLNAKTGRHVAGCTQQLLTHWLCPWCAGAPGPDDAPMMPFNLKSEREEGFFDDEGNYVFRCALVYEQSPWVRCCEGHPLCLPHPWHSHAGLCFDPRCRLLPA